MAVRAVEMDSCFVWERSWRKNAERINQSKLSTDLTCTQRIEGAGGKANLLNTHPACQTGRPWLLLFLLLAIDVL